MKKIIFLLAMTTFLFSDSRCKHKQKKNYGQKEKLTGNA